MQPLAQLTPATAKAQRQDSTRIRGKTRQESTTRIGKNQRQDSTRLGSKVGAKKVRWKDEGLLLTVTRHGEGAARLSVLTKDRGVWNGLARAKSRKGAAFPPLASRLQVQWTARLESHLGHFVYETMHAQAAKLFDAPTELLALQSLCVLCLQALPERDPCGDFYESTLALSQTINPSQRWFADYLRWEHRLLRECGFGLDLSRCCVTGSTHGLAWLSPRTGRAVSLEGLATPLIAPYRARLLALPPALLGKSDTQSLSRTQWYEGLSVLGFFLNKFLDTMPTPRLQLQEIAQQ